MKSAVIRFPGSNCERDSFTVLEAMGMHPVYVWHEDSSLPQGLDVLVIPGGFTYGDYLRVGAMAANAPIMREVASFAGKGGIVLGICNGFQILCEARMLAGTLMKNSHLRFNCRETFLRVERTDSHFTSAYSKGQVINIPIAHHDGSYYADEDTLKQLNDNNQVMFRYCDEAGMIRPDANPNGSVQNIAGICNAKGNVLGMMPHPERHADALIGGTDGRAMFESLLHASALA